MPTSNHALRVTRVVGEARDVLSFRLSDPDGRDLPPWTPGAHIDVYLPQSMVRQYSLCGDPADRRSWRIAVLREQPGRGGSRYLHDELRVGSIVEVGAPRNNFPLVTVPRYRFLAGGIGITPLLAMVAVADAAGADWVLDYGGQARERMAFLGELAAYGDRVRVHEGLLPLAEILGVDADGAAVYCCGPEPLLAAVERVHSSPHVERFHPRTPDTAPVADTAFEVVIDSTGQVVRVAAGQSILTAVSRAGIDVTSSCREGTCASCETTVLAGVVDHRDSVLSDVERTSGRTMMLCVSRARSPRLVLDL